MPTDAYWVPLTLPGAIDTVRGNSRIVAALACRAEA